MSRFPGLPTASGWRPALRIARRDALRARGRSLLVLLMVALPVLGMTVADVVARSAQLDPGEKATRELGQTQARLQWYGFPGVEQSPDAGRSSAPAGAGDPQPAPPFSVLLTDARSLTGGHYRAVVESRTSVTVATRTGRAGLDLRRVDYADAALRGRYRPLAGRAPQGPDEVAATPAALSRLGVTLGGTVQLLEPRRAVRVVGEVGGAATDRGREIALFGVPQADNDVFSNVYLAGGPALTWTDVLALNKLGYVVLSRDVILHPPAAGDVPLYRDQGAQQRGNQLLVEAMLVVTAVVLATLEVVLLAGAAFAVGARRQARSLGLVSATGGSAMDVRRIVLAGGLVLGAAGALVGVGAGLGLAAGLLPLAARHLAGVDPGHFDVRTPELLAISLVGLVTGLLAAVVPARSAARLDPVAALTGRRGQVRTPRRTPVVGLLLLVAGVAAAAVGSALALAASVRVNPTAGGRSWLVAGLIGGGALLVQLGVVVCSPAIVGATSRLGRVLPLASRFALRDAARHRGRSAPAVAAVSAAVAGSVALGLFMASQSDAARREYSLSWPVGTAGVVLAIPAPEDPNDPSSELRLAVTAPGVAERAFERTLPVASTTQVRVAFGCVAGVSCTNAQIQVPAGNQCPADAAGSSAPTGAERARLARDPRCSHRQLITGSLPGAAVGGLDVVRLMLGASTPQAATALAAGGVVVSDPQFVDGGRVTFLEQTLGADGKPTTDPRMVTLPGAAVPGDAASALMVESPAAAQLLGQRVVVGALVASLAADPKAAQEDAAREALVDAGVAGSFGVERGYRDPYRLDLLALVVGAGIITLGASGIATGLAQADARADHATLAAVGAAPRLRRRLAGAQALTVAGLGTVLGIASGFVPAVALIAAIDRYRLVWPWTTLAEVLVGIPLLAGATAWLFTRSRVPLERRLAD